MNLPIIVAFGLFLSGMLLAVWLVYREITSWERSKKNKEE